MSWTANGVRLHDSVLDPGYSTQIDLRTLYVAYDMGHILTASIRAGDAPLDTIIVEGRLGFGTVRVFRQGFALEDAIGFHACSLLLLLLYACDQLHFSRASTASYR
jgi:hypothetical protein